MEPFYFKSYDKVVATARSIDELHSALESLSKTDPACASWHLKEGHVCVWLTSIGEPELSRLLRGISDPAAAALIIRRYSERRVRRSQGGAFRGGQQPARHGQK